MRGGLGGGSTGLLAEGLGGVEAGRGNCGRDEKQIHLKIITHSDHFAENSIL